MRSLTITLTAEHEAGLDAALAAANARIEAQNTENLCQYQRELAAWEEAARDYEGRKAAYVPLPRRKLLLDKNGVVVTRKGSDGQVIEVLDPQCMEAQGLSDVPAELPPMPPRPEAPTPRAPLSDRDAIVHDHMNVLLRSLERQARRG